jgi:PIN domain nuclease of toxin-antitoxin system
LLLLDSHALLWWESEDARLSIETRRMIESPEVTVRFSAVSVWELGIKQAKGKLTTPAGFVDALVADGFRELPVSAHHALLAAVLPQHHSDPFDRMLIAQARSEGLTVVTRDERFAAYGVPVLW